MRIRIFILLLFYVGSQNVLAQNSRTLYSIKPKDFKDLKTVTITVENDQPFGVDFIVPDDSAVKKATAYVNDFESQIFERKTKRKRFCL